MELVVALAIFVLCVVFVVSLLALCCVCRTHLDRRRRMSAGDRKPILRYSRESVPGLSSLADDQQEHNMHQLHPAIGGCSNMPLMIYAF
jgi:hypothetical protein